MLKGKAFELVRDKVQLPVIVLDVINTLKTFFGHRDQILDRLIEKARNISINKERLETLSCINYLCHHRGL